MIHERQLSVGLRWNNLVTPLGGDAYTRLAVYQTPRQPHNNQRLPIGWQDVGAYVGDYSLNRDHTRG